jgi:nucleotide-binding universal stress UspA family protein
MQLPKESSVNNLCDIVVQLNSHPEPTPAWAIDAAADIAHRFGARLSVGLCQVDIPDVSNWLARQLVRSDEVIAAENLKSQEAARALLERFHEAVPADMRGEEIIVHCPALVSHWKLAESIRSYDLIVVPVYGHAETRSVIEGLAFETGRPVLALPPAGGAGHTFRRIVVGWDNSRAAARALADSLPFCAKAETVVIVRVVDEKELSQEADPAIVVSHLAAHGIEAVTQDVPAGDLDAGQALLDHCRDMMGDLLVMGAYGHSRAREFILGGATRSVLAELELPILLSH